MRKAESVSMLKYTKDFKRSWGYPFLFPCAVLFLFLIAARQAFPQDAVPSIKEIVFQVEGKPVPANMEELIPLKPGDEYSLHTVNESIKRIYKTDLFSQIEVLREGRNHVRLIFVLTRKFFVRRVSVKSRLSLPEDDLAESVSSLQKGEAFSSERLAKAKKELADALRLRGYFSPEFRVEMERDEEAVEVEVIIRVESAERYRIQDVRFSGEPHFATESLITRLGSRPGDVYNPSKLRQDIEKLKNYYRSQNFQRAEISVGKEVFHEESSTVDLFLDVNSREKIEIETKGAKIPEALLKPIWEERIFEEWGLSEGEAKIKDFLRNKGFLFPEVRSSIRRSENTIRVIYDIDPGREYNLGDIIFKGNETYPRETLMEKLGIPKKIPFISWIDEAVLFELPGEIKAFYGTQGFPETDVDLSFATHKEKINAVYLIKEGPREIIRYLDFEGADIIPKPELLERIDSREGGAFFRPAVQKDIEALEQAYLDKGVRGTRIRAEVQREDEFVYSVVFDINEGAFVTIEKILITGNKATRRGTILKELRVNEGDRADYSALQESKRRLERLGIFTDVKIEEIPLDVKRENIIISVREGERNYASLGIGLETEEEPRSFAVWNNVIRPRGTAELMRNNVFGTAAQLSLVGQISLREKRAVISWEQPYFFGLPLETYLTGWIEREARKSYSFDRRGASLTAIKSFSEEKLLLSTLRLARTTLFDLQFSPSEVDRQFFPFSTTSLSESFIWDKRNDPFNPVDGHFFSLALEWAYPLFNSESDFLKLFTKYQHFVPLFDRVVFSATARLGLGRGRIPIHERFFAGGSNSFRGTKFDELGPKDPDSFQPVGGKALTLINFELTFPLLAALEDLFGTVFYDVGNVFAKRSEFNLKDIQNALGFGLRYRTPLGPVRLEVAWNLDIPEGEQKFFTFFTIGHVF